jgi:hypothetical protein
MAKSWLNTRGDEIEMLVVAVTRRFVWPMWRGKKEAMARAAYYVTKPRRTKLFECERCHKDGLKPLEINCHHIEEVIPKTGFDNLEDTIRRILCEADGIQVLCKKCHLEVHAGDQQERATNRKKPRSRKAKTARKKQRGKRK